MDSSPTHLNRCGRLADNCRAAQGSSHLRDESASVGTVAQRDFGRSCSTVEAKEEEKRLSYVLDAEEDCSAIETNKLTTDEK